MRTFKYTVVILGIIAAVGIGAYFYIVNSFTNSNELEKTAKEITERQEQPMASSYEKEKSVDLDMTEHQVQVYLHKMTHQHVVADKKWGSVPTTQENIENLLVIVQANQDSYKHSDYYIDVMKKWEEGDFSNAVEVHNFIWSLHQGTVGRATGLLE